MRESRNNRVKRLIYRSVYRGCKETDCIFGDFAQTILQSLSDAELDDYEALLEVDDSTLYTWFNGSIMVPSAYDTLAYRKVKEYNEQRFTML